MSYEPQRRMVISPLWLQASLLTFVAGFAVLGILAVLIYRHEPPIPERTVGPNGEVLFTGADIRAGQGVFQKYGLMQYGTLYGHGAYLGPDFTADYLHRQALLMQALYQGETGPDSPAERVVRELQTNRYDAATGTLTFTRGQAHAFSELQRVYAANLRNLRATGPLPAVYIKSSEELRQLTAFFA